MTGPENYANAESDLEHAAHASDKGRLDDVTYYLGCAQVHATLALAAAAADLLAGDAIARAKTWIEVTR